MSCAGGGQAKFDEDEKPTGKKEDKVTAKAASEETAVSAKQTKETRAATKAAKKQEKLAKKAASPKTAKKQDETVRAKSPIRIETNLSSLHPPNTFVDVPTVISLDIQASPLPVAKKDKDSPAVQQQVVAVETTPQPVVVKEVIKPASEETTNEIDTTKFISLDTDEATPADVAAPVDEVQVEKVELVSAEVVDEQQTSAPQTTESEVVVVKPLEPQQQLDEGPITPPTTPELKPKSDIK